nr:CoB--CoM heterodisulfide reductase iron-sulfur subunit A family protein [Desulfobacterales bacterium]
MEKCIACGICAEKCPAKAVDEFNQGLATRKAAYLPYAQAVPFKYVLDPGRCIYFKKGGRCKACEKFCPAGAINFDEKEEIVKIEVGSIILTGGFRPFDPSRFDNYQYSTLPNVVSSIEFERILSAGGPYAGDVVRLSDQRKARRIAWLQCVGSRDVNRCDNEYCSSVCCMYAIKEAMVAKEHIGDDFVGAIFYMDIRTYGKGFERYLERAKSEGVRFIRSRVHTITQADETGTLKIEYYLEESGKVVEEEFDMVVLSVGMEPAKPAVDLAKNLGIRLNQYNFVDTEDFLPVATSRPGIYVAGLLQGCKDIPQCVMEASAAACASATSLAPSRGQLIKEHVFPKENDVTDEGPRIGVFVCNCGVNIGGFADVPAIAEYAKTLPNVVYVEENLFTCSQDTQEKMVEVIREHALNRLVVAACSPKTHEALFQETIRKAGLNQHLFEMANIRNQCTWVHSDSKETATEKAKDLVRMAIAKASLLEPIPDVVVEIERSALVIGGGVAGMNAALSLADQGFPTTIVEKSSVLGGNARDIKETWGGKDVNKYLSDLVNRVESHPRMEVLLNAEVTGSSGFIGNFETEVLHKGEARIIKHGVGIIATGARASSTDEYLYGKNPRVTRWHELEQDPDKIRNAKAVAFILCVGSRDERRPYCSRLCCTTSITQAIHLKEQKPDMEIFILYRDIRTYGEKEALYRKAREKGIIFIRYTPEKKPIVNEVGDGLEIRVFDPVLQRDLLIKSDFLNLATAIEPSGHEELASYFKLPLDDDRFFVEAHAKLRPVDFANDGLFVCGLAHHPKPIDESITQAMAAASRASVVLSKPSIKISPIVAQIDSDRCIGCGLCAQVCSFGGILMEEIEGKGYRAKNIQASCKGCGLCAASCPQRAVDMLHFRDRQILAAVSAGI